MDTTNIINHAAVTSHIATNHVAVINQVDGSFDGMSPFCFVLWLAVIIATTTVIITYLTLLYKYLKGRIVISTSKINLESEILKNLRELVKADENRKKDSNVKLRKFVYKKADVQYDMYSEDELYPKPDEPSNQNE